MEKTGVIGQQGGEVEEKAPKQNTPDRMSSHGREKT